jgi:hypothetical protein
MFLYQKILKETIRMILVEASLGEELPSVFNKLVNFLWQEKKEDSRKRMLALAVFKAISTNSEEDINKANELSSKFKTLKIIQEFPKELWTLFHDLSGHTIDPKKNLPSNLLAQRFGLGKKTLQAFFNFKRYALEYSSLEDEKSPYESTDFLREQEFRRDLSNIDTVLTRLPSKIENNIRKQIRFKIPAEPAYETKDRAESALMPGSKPTDPEWYSQRQEDKYKEIGQEYNLQILPMVLDKKQWPTTADGLYYENEGIIWLKSPVTVTTVAHEVGHAVFSQIFSLPKAKEFFQNIIEENITKSGSPDEFISLLKKTFTGLRMRDTIEAVDQVIEKWGADYVSKFEKYQTEPLRRGVTKDVNKKLTPLLKKNSKEVAKFISNKLIFDNKKLLGSFNEIWAETFARVIIGSGAKYRLNPPGVMISLVNKLLELSDV